MYGYPRTPTKCYLHRNIKNTGHGSHMSIQSPFYNLCSSSLPLSEGSAHAESLDCFMTHTRTHMQARTGTHAACTHKKEAHTLARTYTRFSRTCTRSKQANSLPQPVACLSSLTHSLHSHLPSPAATAPYLGTYGPLEQRRAALCRTTAQRHRAPITTTKQCARKGHACTLACMLAWLLGRARN